MNTKDIQAVSQKSDRKLDMMGLSPKEISKELDRFIVGQDQAKKVVAIALRNRYRRINVPEPLRSEIMPKNILMIGSTGVGKTEIARRLAKMASAPFIKVEATKFTEVGYVGRDVESIVRDLLEIAINYQKSTAKSAIASKAKVKAIERIVDALVGKTASPDTRAQFRKNVLSDQLDNTEIEIDVIDNPAAPGGVEIPGIPGAAMGVFNISEMLGKAFGGNKVKQRKLTVKEAKRIITLEESDKMIDQDKIIQQAISSVENDGIVFLDEIDKITSKSDSRGAEVSREGVQRDLLPLIEGTSVATKYGTVNTDHILFIASGAFHLTKPSDLLPELQGRLPIRVEMNPLTKGDLVRILLEPESSLIKQYTALIATENYKIKFTEAAISEIAGYAEKFNMEIENIGARRLHTILEKLLEDISYDVTSYKKKNISIDDNFVKDKLIGFVKNIDLAKFIL
ncbi:ATP-dependent protease ATPase subunit HslU [Rickettsia endosymbiont of Cardiosporidium cionae]|uniref:ATP-dependent protease ATPase subunit HslU n=1 Tax=Rickettsia endosymbiont of Cardiosporidium cionae TaxID=2777155 RepID=UPI002B4B1929|nr:ATP-dependent protease ATPase subunit HslU [Rickettsia endosymbiont of Cardiosporidium cionae]KAF8818607.1 ATP-dependent protease ATPase subunit HslU [Rickettsia endosymbiont of Cardiosporidium cionae]